VHAPARVLAQVPGFPRHPHRGFETVTVVRHGLIDHTDGLGNGGRETQAAFLRHFAAKTEHLPRQARDKLRKVDNTPFFDDAGRFGNGDTQWMTAGKGITHSEMFPLLKQDGENR
jgi:redox-sensitive bicupin YhaK (pirin superfamily)